VSWRTILLRNSKIRKEFYKTEDYTGRVPWKLKIGRENLPDAISKVKQQEKNDDSHKWMKSAEHWLNHRSNGTENGKPLPKDEIKKRKKELGKLLTEYNRYYSDGNIISF
jgi:hypothetical protein